MEVQDPLPDQCPHCHTGVEPRVLDAFLSDPTRQDNNILVVLQCPKNDCKNFFGVVYAYSQMDSIRSHREVYRRSEVIGGTFKGKVISAEIKAISPKYAEILNQALAAKAWRLSEVAGPGLRKALEFLIRDFLKVELAGEPDKLEGMARTMALGAVISNFIGDPSIKTCASRAAFLGNEETHYYRTWTEHDINDLETLLDLTEKFVGLRLSARKYEAELNPPPSKRKV